MNFPVSGFKHVSIQKIYSATSTEWDDIWKNCDYATHFHSREWAELWAYYYKNQVFLKPKLVTFSDGKQALLPLVVKRRYGGLVNEYISCVEGGFGGWISTDSLTYDHAASLTNLLAEELGSITWRFNPYEPLIWKMNQPYDYADETHAIHLEKDFNLLFKNQSSTVRKARKAEKAGVEISLATTLSEWREYYDVYQSSLKRWGEKAISEYRWDIFQKIFERNSNNIRLWIAHYQGRIVSGAVCLYANRNIMYWHGASLEEFFQVRPVNLLMYTIMRDGYEQGYSWFDFGSSGGLESVAAFKKSFGATPLPCHVVCKSAPLKQMVEKIEYRLQTHPH